VGSLSRRLAVAGAASLVAFLISAPAGAQDTAQAPPTAPAAEGGRIAGRVVDRESGRPLQGVQVLIRTIQNPLVTNLDGRYRSPALAPGRYSVSARFLGYRPVTVDSVDVTAGRTVTADLALAAAPIMLEGIEVRAEVIARPSIEAGLLALQQMAPVVSDGISAEAIRRTPDSDAADAVKRITGIAIQNDQFVVVRGLEERYSNALLNGSELASPEPERRVVPFDVFPAGLLESIVASKSATPDKPGDFAGGSVQIETKEFPDEFTGQISVNTEYDELASFEMLPVPRDRGGLDFLGFDDGRRAPPSTDDFNSTELRLENYRNVWTPTPRRVYPNLGFSANVGGRTGGAESPLGYVIAANYSSKTKRNRDRFFSIITDRESAPIKAFLFQEATRAVDWGGILNLSYRPSASSKLSFKNLYTRNAEEDVISNEGYDIENSQVSKNYQVRYIERGFLQSQVSGEHSLGFLLGSRLEWRGTLGLAVRNEPDNRQVEYPDAKLSARDLHLFWSRFLDDRVLTGALDWSVPFGLWRSGDATLRIGGLYKQKRRAFTAGLSGFRLSTEAPAWVAELEPEQAFTPEILGDYILFESSAGFGQSYDADDDVAAGYGMLDAPLLSWLRLVGGARLEDWNFDLYPEGRDIAADSVVARRRNRDLLWSGNLTVSLSDRINLRLSGFRSVSRPDAREIATDTYLPVTGECELTGSSTTQRATILNGDARWEWYPRPGELISISGFYKRFQSPIIEFVQGLGGGDCRIVTGNAQSARNFGGEFEVRKGLDFLPGPLANLVISGNFTVIQSSVVIDSAVGTFPEGLDLAGQSPYLINGSVAYLDDEAGFEVSAAYNYFADRITRYGRLTGSTQGPDLVERGRGTLDAKLQKRFGRLGLSLSAKNLTNEPIESIQDNGSLGVVTVGSEREGRRASLSLSLSF
jgi:hypothetical protein